MDVLLVKICRGKGENEEEKEGGYEDLVHVSVKYFMCLIVWHLVFVYLCSDLVTTCTCRDNSPSSLLLPIPLFCLWTCSSKRLFFTVCAEWDDIYIVSFKLCHIYSWEASVKISGKKKILLGKQSSHVSTVQPAFPEIVCGFPFTGKLLRCVLELRSIMGDIKWESTGPYEYRALVRTAIQVTISIAFWPGIKCF